MKSERNSSFKAYKNSILKELKKKKKKFRKTSKASQAIEMFRIKIRKKD